MNFRGRQVLVMRIALALVLGACQGGGAAPTASPFPSPALSPNGGATSYRPECFPEDEWVSCQDDRLGLAFRYPASWGFLVEARFTEGECGGRSLAYSFDPWYTGPQVGGASPDYCQPGTGSIQRFSGFPSESARNTDLLGSCRQVFPQADFCQAISDQVWLVGLFPDAQEVCLRAGGTVPQPRLAVAINLPEGRPIGGLVFGQVFLSQPDLATLFAPIGGPTPNRGLCRQAEALDGYQKNVDELAQKISDGRVDKVTLARAAAIRQLGESVSFNP